jgi:predicted nuclease of restriction endonuclease-like RecB superfamily
MRRSFNHEGIEYSSLFEMEFAKDLIRRKIEFEYESYKLEYLLKVRGGKCLDCASKDVVEKHIYWPDFYLPKQGIFVETKGKFSPKDRNKILAVIKNNPGIDLRLIFMRDNWTTRTHNAKYSDWCKKNNVEYSFVFLPDVWAKHRREKLT